LRADLSARTDTQGPALNGKVCCVAMRRVMLSAKKDRSQWYLGDEGESCDSACSNAGAKCFAHNAASASSSMSPKLLYDAAREAGVECTESEAVRWLPFILPAIIKSRVYNTSGESGGPQNENVQAVCFYALQTSTEGGRGRDADRESNNAKMRAWLSMLPSGSSPTSTLVASPACLARRASLTATMQEAYGNQY
jgi:hypothetical protein